MVGAFRILGAMVTLLTELGFAAQMCQTIVVHCENYAREHLYRSHGSFTLSIWSVSASSRLALQARRL